jgi:hypothetical protein
MDIVKTHLNYIEIQYRSNLGITPKRDDSKKISKKFISFSFPLYLKFPFKLKKFKINTNFLLVYSVEWLKISYFFPYYFNH